jgi:hypothetical protein
MRIRNVASHDKASVINAEITCSFWAGYLLGYFSKPESCDSAVYFQLKYANYRLRQVAYINPQISGHVCKVLEQRTRL